MTHAPRKPVSSTADLGGRDNTLDPIPWTPAQRTDYEQRAEQTVRQYFKDDPEPATEILQMLGLEQYVSIKRTQDDTPLLHGRRATFVNRKCKCDPCNEANNAYFRERRAKQAEAGQTYRRERRAA